MASVHQTNYLLIYRIILFGLFYEEKSSYWETLNFFRTIAKRFPFNRCCIVLNLNCFTDFLWCFALVLFESDLYLLLNALKYMLQVNQPICERNLYLLVVFLTHTHTKLSPSLRKSLTALPVYVRCVGLTNCCSSINTSSQLPLDSFHPLLGRVLYILSFSLHRKWKYFPISFLIFHC